MCEPWVQSLEPQKLDLVVHTYNPSTWEVEVGGSEIQTHPYLHSTFEASLGYMKLCLEEKAKPQTKNQQQTGLTGINLPVH